MKLKDIVWKVQFVFSLLFFAYSLVTLLHCGAFMFVGSFWFGLECVVCFFFSMFGLLGFLAVGCVGS